MAFDGRILILTIDLEKAQRLGEPLESEGFEVAKVTTAAEAIQNLRETPYDLIVVDTQISRPSAVEFLAKALQFLPAVERTLYEDSPGEIEPRQLVNEAAPSAIFTGAIVPEQVRGLLERHRAVLRAAAVPAAPAAPPPPPIAQQISTGGVTNQMKELMQLKSRVTHLEKENARLTREAVAGTAPTVATAALFAGRGAVVDKMRADKMAATPAKERNPEQAAQRAFEMSEKNTNTEIDLMQEDMVSEAARVIYLMLKEPNVRLPVLPQVGNELRKMTANENVSFDKIAEVVALDAGLSARIMEVANSPLYAGADQIRSLSNAVSRIGMRETRNLVQAVVFENIFSTKDRRLAVVMTKLWMHSLAVAFANEILARRLAIESSDDLFMMGLLHDIGKLGLVYLIEDGYQKKTWSRKTVTDEMLAELLILYHNDVGRQLLQGWEYPDPFLNVIVFHNDDTRIYERDEAVIVTYYSNLLTRKLGFSLRPHREDLLNNHDVAQALNMSDDIQKQIEDDVKATIEKVNRTFMRAG